MNPNVPEPPIEKEFLLRIPKEAITINNGKLFFNENYMGQCCGAWVAIFFMALDALSRTYISSYAVNHSGRTIPLTDFDPKEQNKSIPKGYTRVDVQPKMNFKYLNEETMITHSIPRFSVFFETCVDEPGITTNDVLMWVLVYDASFLLEEFIIQYISTLKKRVSEEFVDPKDLTTPNKVRKNKKAIQCNDGGDIYRLLSNFNIYCDGVKYLSATSSIIMHESSITIKSKIAPSKVFAPKSVLSRLTCWNKSDNYTSFYRRYELLKPFLQHFGYDFINNHAKFNALCLPYEVPMEVYRHLIFNIISREFPNRPIHIDDVPEIIQFKYVYETDIDPFFYVHCYFLMWKQMLDEKVQLYRYLTFCISNMPYLSLRPDEHAVLSARARTLRESMLDSFLVRVKRDLKPFENASMLGNCSSAEFDVWNVSPVKNIFDASNFIKLSYGTNENGEQLDLDDALLLFNHYMLTYDLDTHFGPRQGMRWSSQLFFDCAAGAAIGKDIAFSLMCGDPSVGKGHNMKQVSRLYPPGIMLTPTNISISFFNNFANTRGKIVFFDEMKKHFMDSKVDTTILNHLKNIGSNGYTGSNQQTSTTGGGGKESISYPYMSGPVQVSGNFGEEFIYNSDDAYFSRTLSQCTGIRPRIDVCFESKDITNIRIMQSIYYIYARFRELQFMGFFPTRKAMNGSVSGILKRFFNFVSENPHYSVFNRTQDQIEMRYCALVTRFAVIKVMCTSWGYNEFHHLQLSEPNTEIYRAINDQIQPSERLMLFVLSLYVETFFSNDSFVVEKEFQEAYRMYQADSKLVLKDIIYTINTSSGVKTVIDPFYVRLNITQEALFNRIKRKNKLGQISFVNGLHSLEKKDKFTVEVDFTSECVVPKTRTCDGEPLLANSGKLRREVSPYIFTRTQDNRIVEIYISKDYLKRLTVENVENYFETFILPNIIPMDFTNTPILTYGGIHYNNIYYIEHLNYASYVAKPREGDSNKSLRTTEDTFSYEAMHDPLSIDILVESNEEFDVNHHDITIPTMFDKRYPRDALLAVPMLARRQYTPEEVNFLVFGTSFFKHAANINLDASGEISINMERIEVTYAKQVGALPENDRKALKEGVTLYRSLKTQIDDNALLYFHADQIIKQMRHTLKDAEHWSEFCEMWGKFTEYADEMASFDYAEIERMLREVDTEIRGIKTRNNKPSLYAQLFVTFPFDEMYRSNNCPNKFVKDNNLHARVFQFMESIYCKYKEMPDFVAALSESLDGQLVPSIVNQFYDEFEMPI